MFKTHKYWWQYLFLAIPIVIFWKLLFKYTVNVPWFDDVEVFPGAVVIWIKSDLWGGIKELFRPNNEHRMLPGKLAGVLCYQLTGQLNMRWLALVANLNLMGILWLFWQFFKKQSLEPIYFLPVCLFLLQPQFYLTSHWSITAWQHQSVLFWGFLTIFLLSKNTQKGYFWATLTVFITTFCMSNGLLFWVAGAAVLLFQKRYKFLMAWGVLMCLGVFLYFYGFNNSANNNGLAYFWQHPHESFFGFFTFFGGAFDFWQQLPIVKRAIVPTVMGFILVSFCAWWLWGNGFSTRSDGLKTRSPYFLFGCLVFLACNGGIIALLRPRFGYFVMLVGNYKIYPALLLVFGYLILISKFGKNLKLLSMIMFLSFIFNRFSYYKFTPDVAERRQLLLVNAYNQQYNGIGLAAELNSNFAKYIDEQMTFLSQRKAYFYPKVFKDSTLSLPLNKQSVFKDISILYLPQNDITIENNSFEKTDGINDGAYMVLKSEKRTYLVATNQNKYQGKNPFGKGKGFKAKLLPKTYQPDNYQVGILTITNGKPTIADTGQSIFINF